MKKNKTRVVKITNKDLALCIRETMFYIGTGKFSSNVRLALEAHLFTLLKEQKSKILASVEGY